MSLKIPRTNLKLFLTIIASKIHSPFEEEDWDAIRFGIKNTDEATKYAYTLFGEQQVTLLFFQHSTSQNVEVQFQTEEHLHALVEGIGRVLEVYSPTSTERIEALVEEAFARNSHPPKQRITSCTMEHLEICIECQEVMEIFQGKHWKELVADGKEPPKSWAGPSFLTEEARRYFLPAYLVSEFRQQGDFEIYFERDAELLCQTPLQKALVRVALYLASEEYYLRFQI
jgi:hypothetical protein